MLNKILTSLVFIVFMSTSVLSAYTPGKKEVKDDVIGLLLFLNGQMIEHVYKPDLKSCLKSKRIAQRNLSDSKSNKGGRVVFSCKIMKAEIEEDNMTKYGYRITKVIEGGKL